MPAGIVEITDRTLWDKFVEDSPQGTVFCKTAWLDIYQKDYKLYGYYKGDSLLGGMCGFTADNFFSSGYATPFTPFQGVLVAPQPDAKYVSIASMHMKVASAFAEFLETNYCDVGISNHYEFPDVRPFLWRNYTSSVKYTYVVDIHDLAMARDALEKDLRWEINKFNLPLRTNFEGFYRLYTETFLRKQLQVPTEEDFMKRLLQSQIKVRVWQTDHSGVVIMQDSKRAYYIFGASDGEGESAYCLWSAIEALNKEGVKEIDLVGCNGENVGNWKRGFGGKLKPYFQVSRGIN